MGCKKGRLGAFRCKHGNYFLSAVDSLESSTCKDDKYRAQLSHQEDKLHNFARQSPRKYTGKTKLISNCQKSKVTCMGMAPISGFIVLCLVITLGYLAGLLTFITDHEENKCDMTFMFEYPQFVRIFMKADLEYGKYGLYAYSEGRFTERARDMHFDGIPVLFIPGNAGSFKQARSFASVALRKGLDSRPGFHFDFFTVDLNSELSGLNGALLNEQTLYVNHSIAKVLQLYADGRRYPPKSVVLIGHSMGGIIAQGLLTTLPRNSTLLPLTITLATPHARPPIALDTYINDYYSKMHKSATLPANSTIISLSGGYNDFLVSPFLTYARNIETLHVVTTSVPLDWLSADHLCILWCRQLVLAITRALFDVVDLTTKQISLDPSYQRAVFQHHLVHHSGTKVRRADYYKLPVSLSTASDEWIENLRTQYAVSLLHGTKRAQWHMIRLLDQPTHEQLTILALNLEVSDWAFACSAEHLRGQTRICTTGNHLSQFSEIAPSIRYKRRLLQLNLHELKKNYTEVTHVVVRVLPTSEPVVLNVDIYDPKERQVEVNLPRWWSVSRQLIITETPEKILHYELVLSQLQHIIQSYKLHVDPVKCTNNVHHATASLTVPWTNHAVHSYITETKRDALHVRLYSSRPHGMNNSFAAVRLTLDPTCVYSISIQNSVFGMLGQIARTYSPMLIANMVAVILLSFRNQLVSIEQTGSCSVFFTAIKYGVKPYYILTMVKLASRGLSWKGFSRILPLPDWQLIAEEGNDFFLLPLLLYMCSVGIVWVAALGLASSLIFCESTFHKIVSKFLARTITGTVKFSDWLIGGFHKLPCVVATFLVILSISTCGGLALCLGCAFYFLKLTQMSQDYVENLVIAIVKYFARKLKRKITPQHTSGGTSQDNVSSQNRLTCTEEDLTDRALCRTEDETDETTPKQEQTESEEDGTASETKSCLNSQGKENKDSSNVAQDENVLEATPGCSSSVSENDQGKPEQSSLVCKENKEAEENKKEGTDPKEAETESNGEPAAHSSIFFHFSIFLLWCTVTGLNLPFVLTWAHNFKYSTVLQPDPSFMPGIILSVCAIPLWQLELPKSNVYWYAQLGQVLNIMVAASLIYAPLSVYRLVYIITATIVLVTLHQLFAPARVEVVEDAFSESAPETPSTPDPETLLNKVKVKWE